MTRKIEVYASWGSISETGSCSGTGAEAVFEAPRFLLRKLATPVYRRRIFVFFFYFFFSMAGSLMKPSSSSSLA
jgi:hypothetical protein